MSQKSESGKAPHQIRRKEGELYVYKDSGIQENHGYIPFWLLLVVIVMVIWGIYYTVKNWLPPGG